MMTELCQQFQITHRHSVKMNGAVEAANKNIKTIIRKVSDNYKTWHEILPLALMAYRTLIRTLTGATTYSLIYGMEAVIPVKVEIPSLRILMESKLEEAEWVCERHKQLCLIDEKCLTTLCYGQCYQKRIARAYNKKVRPRHFKEGNLVPKKIFYFQEEVQGKFAPNWEGPFIIKKALSGRALILTKMDGDVFPEPINFDSVKIFYA